MDRSVACRHNQNHVIFNSFAMDDWLALVHTLMKLGVVVALMVLVATAPTAAARTPKATGVLPSDAAATCPATNIDDDISPHLSRSSRLSNADDGPPNSWDDGFNIDGTLMNGDFDIYGNPFGVTESDNDQWDGSSSSLWD